MAKVIVIYTAKITEFIEWPDDEMDDFDNENLLINLNSVHKSQEIDPEEIISVKVDGSNWEF